MRKLKEVNAYLDSGCTPNPGLGSIGLVITDEQDRFVRSFAEIIGHQTSNRAAYRALIKGLELSTNYTIRRVVLFTVNDLLIEQMKGSFKVDSSNLTDLYSEAKKREENFRVVLYKNSKNVNCKWKFLANELRKRELERTYVSATRAYDLNELFEIKES